MHVRRATCVAAWIAVAALAVACGNQSQPVSSSVYSPSHASLSTAVRHFFNVHSTAVQPLPFPHKTHIEKQAMCTDCHETVERGPIAGIPSVRTCMNCHTSIATDRPLIKEVTSYYERGVDIPWQRVYGFPHEAHVRFNHAPHIRAQVECSTCHGDIPKMSVAERVVDHTMGFCVNCHRQKKAPNDCLTCHY